MLSGRNAQTLQELAAKHGLEARVASVDDSASLDRALAGTAAVINCAGPFASTTGPAIEAALRAKIPYLDVAAELEANLDTFAHYGERARDADEPCSRPPFSKASRHATPATSAATLPCDRSGATATVRPRWQHH